MLQLGDLGTHFLGFCLGILFMMSDLGKTLQPALQNGQRDLAPAWFMVLFIGFITVMGLIIIFDLSGIGKHRSDD